VVKTSTLIDFIIIIFICSVAAEKKIITKKTRKLNKTHQAQVSSYGSLRI